MSEFDLGPDDYREVGSTPPFKMRRGFAKWLYFARHPVLAFVTYQLAYPDPDDSFKVRQTSIIMTALGWYLARKLTGNMHY